MKNIIFICDFLGYEPKLYIKERTRYTSWFTSILSILIVIMSLSVTGYFGKDLFIKAAPTLIASEQMIDSLGPYNFSNTGINVIFTVQNEDFSYYKDPSVVQVEGELIITKNVINQETGQTETLTDVKEIKMDICSKYYTNDDIIEKNLIFPLDYYYCPEPN